MYDYQIFSEDEIVLIKNAPLRWWIDGEWASPVGHKGQL